MRPANIVTAVADVLAGAAISGCILFWPAGGGFVADRSDLFHLFLLCLSTAGLYGGGVVFNDVFDADLDLEERPERPIPSGLISIIQASVLGTLLLLAGILFAAIASNVSGLIALAIAFLALVYDRWGKHYSFLGPLNMGSCRGLNLLLGISIVPFTFHTYWIIVLVPLVYIFSITMISRGEVHGGKRDTLYLAALLYAVVISMIVYFAYANHHLFYVMVVLLPFCWMIYAPLLKALEEPTGKHIGKAVKAGVISLILMDAAWAAAFGQWFLMGTIVVLLPVSIGLSRLFAVT